VSMGQTATQPIEQKETDESKSRIISLKEHIINGDVVKMVFIQVANIAGEHHEIHFFFKDGVYPSRCHGPPAVHFTDTNEHKARRTRALLNKESVPATRIKDVAVHRDEKDKEYWDLINKYYDEYRTGIYQLTYELRDV
jgi:hypothetical protein